MRTTLDLPDELLKRAKITAVERGLTLRELVADGLRRVLASEESPTKRRMTEPPIKLPSDHIIPTLSNRETAKIFAEEDAAHMNDVYRRR